MFGSWYEIVKPFLVSDDFPKIGRFLKEEVDSGRTIFPLFDNVFRCFKECPLDKLRVVILTSNAYMDGEADGLALSNSKAKGSPFHEWHMISHTLLDAVEEDVAENKLYLDRDPDLTRWANQGVLLLNCDLSSEKDRPGGHVQLWRPFIEYILTMVCLNSVHIVFVLLGKEAGKYEEQVVSNRHDHYLLEHPMKAAREKRPWRHHRIFTTINNILNFIHGEQINWTGTTNLV